jgi:hypothetical protein
MHSSGRFQIERAGLREDSWWGNQDFPLVIISDDNSPSLVMHCKVR